MRQQILLFFLRTGSLSAPALNEQARSNCEFSTAATRKKRKRARQKKTQQDLLTFTALRMGRAEKISFYKYT